MLELRIDPTKCTPDQVRAASAFLLSMIGQVATGVPDPTPRNAWRDLPPEQIDPVDNPAAGSPTSSDAAQAFGNLDAAVDQAQAAAAFGTLDPAAAFGTAGNGAALPAAVAGNAVTSVPTTSSMPPVVPSVPNAAGANVNVEVDRDGLPWDVRIHASSKAKNADGRWRGKRGIDDAVIAQVTAELRQVAAIPTPNPGAIVAAVQAAQNPGNVPLPPSTGAPAAAIATPNASATNPAVGTSVANVQALNAAPSIDYATFIGKITAGLTSNPPTLAQATLQATLAAHGIAGLPVLATRPDLVPVVAAALGLA
jgi:hypothetical protein